MTAAEIVRAADAAGVSITLAPSGKIWVEVTPEAVNHWLPAIVRLKQEIIQLPAGTIAPGDWQWRRVWFSAEGEVEAITYQRR